MGRLPVEGRSSVLAFTAVSNRYSGNLRRASCDGHHFSSEQTNSFVQSSYSASSIPIRWWYQEKMGLLTASIGIYAIAPGQMPAIGQALACVDHPVQLFAYDPAQQPSVLYSYSQARRRSGHRLNRPCICHPARSSEMPSRLARTPDPKDRIGRPDLRSYASKIATT